MKERGDKERAIAAAGTSTNISFSVPPTSRLPNSQLPRLPFSKNR